MEEGKGIYKLNIDCGRMGQLDGVFIADKSHVRTLIEKKIEVYWGEVLGKHSEVFGVIEPSEIIMVSEDPNAIKVIEDLRLTSGYNPFNETAINFEYEGIEDADGMTIQELVEKIISLKCQP
jgi:hypothetical protein